MSRLFLVAIIIEVLVLSSISLGYSGGSGTPQDPFQIASKTDLLTLAATADDYNKCFILTADIYLNGQVFTTAVIGLANFKGTFDGNDHTITHFTINKVSNGNIGFFMSSGGSIKNLRIGDYTVSGSYTGMGDGGLGGLAGHNYGSITNCFATGTVNVSYSGISSFIGGLVGHNYGSITNSGSTGLVSVSKFDYVGGLVGGNSYSGSISNSYATGSVSGGYSVGGLVGGNNEGSISNSYATGSVSGTYNIGGLVGHNYFGNINNCYSTGSVGGKSYIGGLVGGNYSGTITNSFWDIQTSGQTTSDGGTGKTTAQMKTLTTFTSAGWDFLGEMVNGTCSYWYMPAGSYPVISAFYGYTPPELPGNGTEQDPYVIADADDLGTVWFRPLAHYVLAGDINLAGITWSMSVVPAFSGVFDGNGFSIDNLSINGGGFLGLIGMARPGSKIKNLGLENYTISGTSFKVGGLVGYCCEADINNCYSTGNVNGTNYVGGLVGYSQFHNSNIVNCYSIGSVSGTKYVGGLAGCNSINVSSCFSKNTVYGTSWVGGLVGLNGYGSIVNCYSTGPVMGSQYVGGLAGFSSKNSITNCYSTGDVNGDSNVGGLLGSNNSGIITNCFWDIQTSGQTTSEGGTGKTTAEMQTRSTFTSVGWDFTKPVWTIKENIDYPRLSWEVGCLSSSSSEYSDWLAWGKPDCWCLKRQCRGDSDNIKTLEKWVSTPDLSLFKSAYLKNDTAMKNIVLNGTPGICADFDHIKTGASRVATSDLSIFKSYFNKPDTSVPCCDADKDCVLDSNDKYNFWTN